MELLEETYHQIGGKIYKTDIFGDILVKSQFGSWVPISWKEIGKGVAERFKAPFF